MISLRDSVEMPMFGVGTSYQRDSRKGTDIVYNQIIESLDLGYRMIDTAQHYGTEKLIGKALKDFQDKTKDFDTKNIFIVTKISPANYDKVEKTFLK
jgi:diketogulonate reductase-like aldo/keto reductase